jgi:hypothetical protein
MRVSILGRGCCGGGPNLATSVYEIYLDLVTLSCTRTPFGLSLRAVLHLSPLSYGPPWAHYLGGYQDRLLGGPLGLLDLRSTAPDGVKHKDCRGEVLG